MRYFNLIIVFTFITIATVSCTPESLNEDQQNTIEFHATGDDPEITPPPSEETGEDDELEPNG
jgi:hypothetical protein